MFSSTKKMGAAACLNSSKLSTIGKDSTAHWDMSLQWSLRSLNCKSVLRIVSIFQGLGHSFYSFLTWPSRRINITIFHNDKHYDLESDLILINKKSNKIVY